MHSQDGMCRCRTGVRVHFSDVYYLFFFLPQPPIGCDPSWAMLSVLILALLHTQQQQQDQLCLGEFTPCSDGSCVMDISTQCRQLCNATHYLCPPSNSSQQATCAPSAESYGKACSNTITGTHLDPNLGIEARLDYLAARTTLDEQIAQLQNNAPSINNLHIPAYVGAPRGPLHMGRPVCITPRGALHKGHSTGGALRGSCR